MPGAKQVFRDYAEGEMRGDVIARAEEQLPGQPLLVPFVRSGRLVREETIEQMRDRARDELLALPATMRELAARVTPTRSRTPSAAARRWRRSTLEPCRQAPKGADQTDPGRAVMSRPREELHLERGSRDARAATARVARL